MQKKCLTENCVLLWRHISLHYIYHADLQHTGIILSFLKVSGQDRSKSLCNITFFISVCCHVTQIYFYLCVCVCVCVCVYTVCQAFLPLL